MKKRIIVVVLSAFSLIMAGCGSETESEQKGNSVPTVGQYREALKKKGDSVFGPRINNSKATDKFRTLSDEEKKRAYDEIK